MSSDTYTPLGPRFGPNFITIEVNDDTGKMFQLQIYPDVNNPLLKVNRLPTHYYFMPQRVYLAKKQHSPEDFDFGATIFKGLMTTEDTIGITDEMTESGTVAEGGGICTFSTTFAIPESVIQKATEMLKNKDYPQPTGFGLFAQFFAIDADDPTPELGMVSITDNDVTIEVPALDGVGSGFFINAQGTGKGSIEATSISSFLVTLNMMAAGAIIGSLKKGISPFTVHYNLKQMFYLNACEIKVIADLDKVYTSFSAAVGGGGFLGMNSFSLAAGYEKCITDGSIETFITMDGASITPELKTMIDRQVEEMQKFALDLVKSEIFDWKPREDTPATADRGLLSSVFGGSTVSLKASYQKRGVKVDQKFTLDTTVTKLDTVAGTLNDLEPAIKVDLDKYLAIVEIDEYFKKIQLAATNNINWDEKLPDGTDLADPIVSAQVQASYPELGEPVRPDGTPNLQTRAEGFHYTIGNKDPKQASELAVWTKDNPNDIINIAFLRLDNAIPEWDTNQVLLRKTVVFNSSDPRVELANNGTKFTQEEKVTGATVLTPDIVGHILVKFGISQRLPKEGNISVTLTCRLGNRTDTIVVTSANQNNALWEVYSDKPEYLNATSFEYDVQVEVVGPNFTDEPVLYGTTQPIKVDLPTGRLKYINPLKVVMPVPSAAQVQKINDYIKAFQAVV